MSRSERCLVQEFKARMRALRPGDVLEPLSSFAPTNCRILVLDRDVEGWLTLSLPCRELRIVGDRKGPYQWSEETETLVDRDGDPHEGIDLNTGVAKAVANALALEYQELMASAKLFTVVTEARIHQLVNADTAPRRRIDALLQNDWLPSVEARLAAAFGEIFGRPLNESEQAHVIALIGFVAQAIPMVDVVIMPARSITETSAAGSTTH